MNGEIPTRRTLLKTAAAGAAVAAFPAAVPGAVQSLFAAPRPRIDWSVATDAATPAGLPAPDPIVSLVNRITFGLLPADLARARRLGFEGFVEEQLDPESIDDAATEAAVAARFPTLAKSAAALLKLDKVEVATELKAAAVYRAVASRRQLYEMMVDFWTNHFNIFQTESLIFWLKTVDDRAVVRQHALGKFRDLLGASAQSPAMLVYLDNASNRKAGPNENYARELMELHTLSINGPQTQTDVQEVARAFTGWTINKPTGAFFYSARDHDDGARTILGHSLPAGLGMGHGERVLDILAAHPSTATFIATKLCKRFVSDTPSAVLVGAVAATFSATGGDARATMRTLLLSDEFRAAADQKLRRPFEHVAAALRTLDAQVAPEGTKPLLYELRLLGQLPFDWHPPNGYPDANAAWGNTNGMLNRWNLGLALGGNHLAGIETDVNALTAGLKNPTAATLTDALARRLLARSLAAADRDRVVQYVADGRSPSAPIPVAKVKGTTAGAIALLLDSPYFQWR